MSADPKPAPKPPRRFWPRFTLRVLLFLFLLTAIGLGICVIGIWTHRAREQQRIVNMILAAGGEVSYDHLPTPEGIVEVTPEDFSLPPQSPPLFRIPQWIYDISSAFQKLLGPDYFYNVVEARIADSSVIFELSNLRKLERLTLTSASSISSEDIVSIARLRSVTRLSIFVSDEGQVLPANAAPSAMDDHALDQILRMKNLEGLLVSNCNFTPEGIQRLSDSQSLRYVEVYSYRVYDVDACLAPFQRAARVGYARIARLEPNGECLKLAQWTNPLP